MTALRHLGRLACQPARSSVPHSPSKTAWLRGSRGTNAKPAAFREGGNRTNEGAASKRAPCVLLRAMPKASFRMLGHILGRGSARVQRWTRLKGVRMGSEPVIWQHICLFFPCPSSRQHKMAPPEAFDCKTLALQLICEPSGQKNNWTLQA